MHGPPLSGSRWPGRAERLRRRVGPAPVTSKARARSALAPQVRSHPDQAVIPPRVLREYALLADGERGALVRPDGNIGWLCVPRWDSDAVFSALIGGRGGYAVVPTGPACLGRKL
jgi:hypothetical protein